MKFRKKPVVIEAVQWNGNNKEEIAEFMGELFPKPSVNEQIEIYIFTLEGTMTASKNDWIIKGVNGEFYPCKPDIFEKTYERVDE